MAERYHQSGRNGVEPVSYSAGQRLRRHTFKTVPCAVVRRLKERVLYQDLLHICSRAGDAGRLTRENPMIKRVHHGFSHGRVELQVISGREFRMRISPFPPSDPDIMVHRIYPARQYIRVVVQVEVLVEIRRNRPADFLEIPLLAVVADSGTVIPAFLGVSGHNLSFLIHINQVAKCRFHVRTVKQGSHAEARQPISARWEIEEVHLGIRLEPVIGISHPQAFIRAGAPKINHIS